MPKRLRYATREELAELLVPYLSSMEDRFPNGDYDNVDIANVVLDALGEMGAPVDALVKITAEEPD